nr:MAG TPA: hypothetical protein [Crassvirales sp.]
METNKNNSNEVKQFAIGTKIEHNGKLYEVVQGKFCNDCSIARICSSNDITSGNRIGDVISRNTRIGIFGECSPNNRDDNTSVVFKEIPKDDSKDEYHKVIPLWIDDNPSELKPVKFDLPNGCEIDIEASDLSKGIVHFKRKWLTLEQIYKLAEENDYLTNRSAIKEYRDGKLVDIANLMDIAKYFNGNWEYSNNGDNYGYMIGYDKTRTIDDGYQVVNINSDTDMYYCNIMFKNEADAQYVIDNPNFRSILDVIFKV